MRILPLHLQTFNKIVICISCLLYAITALNSHGYYHADEHYQIIEFASLKLGKITPGDLAWEYDYRIRSAFQPAVCFVLFKLLYALGMEDPYYLAASLRLLTAGFAIAAIWFFVRTMLPSVQEPLKKPYILCSYLLWFLPFLNVRFSSETWSGLFFLVAVAVIHGNTEKKGRQFLLAGILLGLGFLCRFQSAIMTVGLLAWMILISRERWKHLLLLLGGGLLSFCVGIMIDAWFYHELVLTSWNYFYINIVENYSSGFGVYPWYFFIWGIAKFPFYPLGIMLLIAILVLVFRQWRSWLVWVILPFIIVQSIIPHKELRFIFPVANLAPLMLIYAVQAIKDLVIIKRNISYFRYLAWCLLIPFILINTAGLLAMAFKSAVNGRREITRFIHSTYRDQAICLLYTPEANPYNPWPQIRENFYMEKQLREINLEVLTDFDIKSINNRGVGLLVIRKRDLAKYEKIIKSLAFKEQLQGFPAWVAWIGNFYDKRANEDMLVLYTTGFNALK